jgi:hypothetical protein
MNERIQELLKQLGGIQHDEDGGELTPILVGKDLAKFAELIIKDCLALIDKRREFCIVAGEYESREYYACMIAKECAFEEAADEIKYQFGVKL